MLFRSDKFDAVAGASDVGNHDLCAGHARDTCNHLWGSWGLGCNLKPEHLAEKSKRAIKVGDGKTGVICCEYLRHIERSVVLMGLGRNGDSN